MTISIREARPSDAPALFVAWSALRAYNSSVDRRIIPAPVSESEFVAGLEVILSRPTSATYVADDEGQVVGFISGSIETNQPDRLPERHATVGYLFVDPGYRKMGIGRQLFRTIADWAMKQDGVSHFEMAVLAADDNAAAFWRRLGFTPFIQRVWAPISALDNEQ